MKGWQERLAAALETLEVSSPSGYVFAGEAFEVPASGGSHDPKRVGHEPSAFVAHLASVLYAQVYSRSFAGRIMQGEHGGGSANGPLEAMAAANASKDRWESGWAISQVLPTGQVVAHKAGAQRTVWAGHYLSEDGPAAPPRPGAQIRIFYAHESRWLQPGFYYAFSEEPEEHSSLLGLVRVYWNISMDGAAALVGALTSRLNEFQVPFRFKCAVSPVDFERTDVAVLYIAKRYFGICADLLQDVLPAIETHLEEDVPLFSKPLARGTGAAEDPGSGESFGQSRCQLVATAVWNRFEQGDQTTGGRMGELARLFGAAGIDPEAPHLNAGSRDRYTLPAESS